MVTQGSVCRATIQRSDIFGMNLKRWHKSTPSSHCFMVTNEKSYLLKTYLILYYCMQSINSKCSKIVIEWPMILCTCIKNFSVWIYSWWKLLQKFISSLLKSTFRFQFAIRNRIRRWSVPRTFLGISLLKTRSNLFRRIIFEDFLVGEVLKSMPFESPRKQVIFW